MFMRHFLPFITTVFFCAHGPLLQAQSIPPLAKIEMINLNKVLNELGKSEEKNIRNFLSEVAKVNEVQIIPNNAIYLDSSLDITELVIKGYKSRTSSSQLIIPASKINLSIAAIDAEKVFNNSKLGLAMKTTLENEFSQRRNDLRNLAQEIRSAASKLDSDASLTKDERLSKQQSLLSKDRELQSRKKILDDDFNKRTFEERTKLANEANIVLAQLAKKLGISAIFDEVAYVSQDSDITVDVIAILNRDVKIDEIPSRAIFTKQSTLAAISSEIIFSSSKLALAMQSQLENEFRVRQNELRSEAVAIKNAAQLLDSQGSSMSEGERQSRQRQLAEQDSNLSIKLGKYTEELNRRTLEERVKIADEVNPIINQYAKLNKINIVLQKPIYVISSLDITSPIISSLKGSAMPTKEISIERNDISITDAKQKCLDLGFKDKTEAFGKCVLRLSK